MTASGLVTRSPRFVNAAAGNCRLAVNSQLREKGVLLDWMVPGATDLDGNPRVANLSGRAFAPGALPDIGCFECQERVASGTTVMVR
jgi:hypothetical protein